MGTLPTGVAVLALHDGSGEPVGLTVNAVTSVSLEPPVLLVCVHQRARIRAILRHGAAFVLNVLSASQAHVARRFASDVADRFVGVDHLTSPAREVRIVGVVAHIACVIRDIGEVGDHSIIYADVTGGHVIGGMPLVFTGGAYTSLAGDGNIPNVSR